MRRLTGAVLAVVVCVSGACLGQIHRPPRMAWNYQGRLNANGDPVTGEYDFDFALYDQAEGGLALDTVSLTRVSVDRGYFNAALNFDNDVFDGSALWLEVRVKVSKLLGFKTTLTPRQPVAPVPYAVHTTKAASADVASSLSGTVDVSQITGLLGQGISLSFPDVLYNRATLEIDGVTTIDRAAVVVAPLGYQIDRIVTYDEGGRIIDKPGFSMEYPLVVELEPGTQCDDVRAYFDEYAGDPQSWRLKDMSVVISDVLGVEVFRFNLFAFAPDGYDDGLDGRTRFTFSQVWPPDNRVFLEFGGPDFGAEVSFDPQTDKGVEIFGIGTYEAEVAVDTAQRTVTLTFGYNEGAGIWPWVRRTVESGLGGMVEGPPMAVIQWDAEHHEVSRKNYFRCFPIRYEILEGFGLDVKVKHRVVITYGIAEDA